MTLTQELRALEEAAMRGRRSPLFLWMHRHHGEFSAILLRAGKPNWKELARVFSKDGLLPSDQKHETVRHTWLAVRKAIARESRETQPPRLDGFGGSDRAVMGPE